MDDDRRRERISLQQTIHPLPGDFSAAMTAAKPFPPEPDHTPPEPVNENGSAEPPHDHAATNVDALAMIVESFLANGAATRKAAMTIGFG